MSANKLALLDHGEANGRILAKEQTRTDFRRVEAASLKRRTHLSSAEGKRIFVRCFYSFQASMYFVTTMGRTKLPHEQVEQMEAAVRNRLEEGTRELDAGIDGADALFKAHNIERMATYDTVPMEEEIGITSALGRRYFEMIHKLDQLMPLLQTLQIEEVISEKQEEQQRSRFKRVVLAMSSLARNYSTNCRRRMNELDARRDIVVATGGHTSSARKNDPQSGETGVGDDGFVNQSPIPEFDDPEAETLDSNKATAISESAAVKHESEAAPEFGSS